MSFSSTAQREAQEFGIDNSRTSTPAQAAFLRPVQGESLRRNPLAPLNSPSGKPVREEAPIPFLIALILVLRRDPPGASGTLDPPINRVFTNETQTIAICMAKAQCAELR
ncbi:hypothetical protein CN090_06155 [Sinorhizobium meliloti]|nr:hypothetical protein C3L21_26410 [Sinorhizobium meliloti]RVE96293.1 hypothetical protein CN235_08285 [Sinorhizobium meliloti]RVG13082.1 hypothetical protein CN234_07300 [Sinorhizobium meliloti]RVG56998.1 hypothetical protein CN226_01580 [Sinorhizobium meliloti]RVG93475.1 hypothetical protein CN218_15160 [Sinorhizobium meliloti]